MKGYGGKVKERLIRRVAPSLLIAIGGGLLLHNIDRGINEPITSELANTPVQENGSATSEPGSMSNGANNGTDPGSKGSGVTDTPSSVPSSDFGGNSGNSSSSKSTPPSSNPGNGSTTNPNNTASVPTKDPAPVASPKRTIIGDAQSTKYGIVQVQIVVDASNKIVDVKAIKLPQGGSNLRYSNYAEPILRDAALNAQSAQISFASGASYTSQGYIASLQSAIDKL